MAAQYRGDNEDKEGRIDYTDAAKQTIHTDIKCAKIFQTTQEEMDILELMKEAKDYEREAQIEEERRTRIEKLAKEEAER